MSAGGVGQAAFAGRPRFLPAVPPALTAALAASFAALLCMLSPPGPDLADKFHGGFCFGHG